MATDPALIAAPSPPSALFPQAFIWKRLHSLTGFGLVLFLTYHLFVNSLAALLPADDGRGFIHTVEGIKQTPLLPIFEWLLLGLPFVIHGIWGVKYLFTASYNSSASDGRKVALPEYRRNRAYSWQRITAWLLLFGIAAHVIHMRFVMHPTEVQTGPNMQYMLAITSDDQLPSLARQLGLTLYTPSTLHDGMLKVAAAEQKEWLESAQNWQLAPHELLAVTDNFGTAEFLMVRDTFKQPLMLILYTLLVLAAVYHAFNGLWTFMISWGITLSSSAQKLMQYLCSFCMGLLAFLGCAAIWGTYWGRVIYG